jgi:small-conductance mechanosensitive channel
VNSFRRVDLKAQLNHSVDHNAAIQLLKERLGRIPNIKPNPSPDVEILEFNLAGPVLAFVPTATRTIIGRFTSTLIVRSANRLAAPDFRFLNNISC